MGSRLYIITILLVIFFCLLLRSQSVEPQFDALPIGIPICVLHDSYGFIWIGGQVGLYRYDGYEIKHYHPEPFNSNSLSTNYVLVIKEDARGNLWIGTWGGGLNYFDQKTEKFTRYMDDPLNPDDIGSNSICNILVNTDGSLWLGTIDNGLLHMSWDNDGNPVYRHFNQISGPRSERSGKGITALYHDGKNILWIGTLGNGLIRFDLSDETIRYFRHESANPNSLSHNIVGSICEDDSGYLWIGTGHVSVASGGGLNRFDRRTETFRHYKNDPADPSSLCSNTISCLQIDQQGILWIGTADNGYTWVPLKELYTQKRPVFRRYSSFWDKIIIAIYQDRLGNIWIAPNDMYIYKYDRQQSPFIYYGPSSSKSDGMKDPGIECLYIDKKGNIWFGHHFSGLDKYDPVTGRYTHFPHLPGSNKGPSSNGINGICEDSYGHLWFATNQNGVDFLDPQTGIFTNIRSDPASPRGLISNDVRCFITSNQGNLWIASQNKGLQLFDIENRTFRTFNFDPDKTADLSILKLFEDHHGKLWICTMNDGLYELSFDQGNLTAAEHYVNDPDNPNSIGNNSVNDLIHSEVYDTAAM